MDNSSGLNAEDWLRDMYSPVDIQEGNHEVNFYEDEDVEEEEQKVGDGVEEDDDDDDSDYNPNSPRPILNSSSLQCKCKCRCDVEGEAAERRRRRLEQKALYRSNPINREYARLRNMQRRLDPDYNKRERERKVAVGERDSTYKERERLRKSVARQNVDYREKCNASDRERRLRLGLRLKPDYSKTIQPPSPEEVAKTLLPLNLSSYPQQLKLPEIHIDLKICDIHKFSCDAVLSVTNSLLVREKWNGDKIQEAAGGDLQVFLKQFSNGCLPGKAVISPSFSLKNFKFILHAVGLVIKSKHAITRRDEGTMICAFLSAFALASSKNCTSIAFPLLSGDGLGYPVRKCLLALLNSFCSFQLINPSTSVRKLFIVVPDSTNEKIVLSTMKASHIVLKDETEVKPFIEEMVDEIGKNGQKKALRAELFNYQGVSLYSTTVKKWLNDCERKAVRRLAMSCLNQKVSENESSVPVVVPPIPVTKPAATTNKPPAAHKSSIPPEELSKRIAALRALRQIELRCREQNVHIPLNVKAITTDPSAFLRQVLKKLSHTENEKLRPSVAENVTESPALSTALCLNSSNAQNVRCPQKPRKCKTRKPSTVRHQRPRNKKAKKKQTKSPDEQVEDVMLEHSPVRSTASTSEMQDQDDSKTVTSIDSHLLVFIPTKTESDPSDYSVEMEEELRLLPSTSLKRSLSIPMPIYTNSKRPCDTPRTRHLNNTDIFDPSSSARIDTIIETNGNLDPAPRFPRCMELGFSECHSVDFLAYTFAPNIETVGEDKPLPLVP